MRRNSLRDYVATNPVDESMASPLSWNRIANNGFYEGWIGLCGHANMSQRIRSGYYGWRMTMRRSGILTHVQHQIASNRSGETSKSRVDGNNNHGYPASWMLGIRIFDADMDWQPINTPHRDIHWTYINNDGKSGGASTNNSRVLFEHNINNLPVDEGQRLLFLIYNRESDVENNHPSVNMTMNAGRPRIGQTPPRATSLSWGDDPLHVRGTGTLSPGANGELFGLGIRYADGIEEGHVGFDSSGSEFTAYLGGSNRARQRWTSPYWRRTSRIAIAAYRLPNQAPQAGLTVSISGPDISTMNLIVPATQIQLFDPSSAPFSYEYTHQLFDLPGELILSPRSVYTVELSSAGSSNTYRINANRRYLSGLNGNITPIEPHRWSGTAEKSSDSGGSWSDVGWAGGGADLPIALVINRRMATSLEALPT